MLDIAGRGDHRIMPPTVEQVNRLTLTAAQAWYEALCRNAPIEVAVVGEIPFEEAASLVERYLGSLPKRERSLRCLDELRKLSKDKTAKNERISVDTITPKGMVMYGFLGCDRLKIQDIRALNLAAQTLSSQLNKRIREEATLVYSIDAMFLPLMAYEDLSLFYTGSPCDPDKVDKVIEEVEALFAAFAEKGPTAEELENAKKQIINSLDINEKEPSYWWQTLQHHDLHQQTLEDKKNKKEKYQSYTAEQVKEAFKKYYKSERIFTVGVTPAPAEEKVEK
jgi:zinc protease